MDPLKNCARAAAFAGVLLLGTAQVSWGQNLVQNGNFTSFTVSPPTNGSGLTTSGYSGATLSNWTNTGYNFVFTDGNRGSRTIQGSAGDFRLWSSGNGLSLAPGGGNSIGADGAYGVGPLSQTITGLTKNQLYAVSFNWAGAQQNGFDGATTESWSVALGGTGFTPNSGDTAGTLDKSQTTTTANNVSHGFTGWMAQTFYFTADGTSDTLYFLANGTPTGQPPFSMLSNVTMTVVPEASTYWTLLLGTAIMLGTWARRQFQKRSAGNA